MLRYVSYYMVHTLYIICMLSYRMLNFAIKVSLTNLYIFFLYISLYIPINPYAHSLQPKGYYDIGKKDINTLVPTASHYP